MFVLNPGGGTGGAGGGSGDMSQKLWFFGKLGLYFGALRVAFLVMDSRDAGTVENGSSSKSS